MRRRAATRARTPATSASVGRHSKQNLPTNANWRPTRNPEASVAVAAVVKSARSARQSHAAALGRSAIAAGAPREEEMREWARQSIPSGDLSPAALRAIFCPAAAFDSPAKPISKAETQPQNLPPPRLERDASRWLHVRCRHRMP